MPRRPTIPCAGTCGGLCWPSGYEAPMCRPCRRKLGVATRGTTYVVATCPECQTSRTLTKSRATKVVGFCSRGCFGLWTSRTRLEARYGPAVVAKTIRTDRDRLAPGLTPRARRALLRAWRAQMRRCIYCREHLADTVDHVIPLVRGGSNYEGNLVPACRSCNSSKQDRLLTEWRMRCQRVPAQVAA